MAYGTLKCCKYSIVAFIIFQLFAVSGFSQKSFRLASETHAIYYLAIKDSIATLNKEIERLDRNGNSHDKILSQLRCSHLYAKINQPDQALISANSALVTAQETSDDNGKMLALTQMGVCYYLLNFKVEALESFLESFQISKLLNSAKETGFLITQIGKVELELGSFVKALDYAQQALDFYIQENNLEGQAIALRLLGNIHTKLGNLDLAESYLNKSIFILERTGNTDQLSKAYVKLGELRIAQHKNNQALFYLSQAAKIIEKDSSSNQNYGQVLRYYAVALSANGMQDEAVAMAKKSIVTLKSFNNTSDDAKSWLVLADIYYAQKKRDEAQKTYQKALDIATQGELKDEKRLAFKGLANVAEQQGKLAEAYQYLKGYNSLNDSILGLSQMSKVIQLENQLITLKKDKELEQKHLEVQQQDLELTHQGNRITILIALLLLAAGIIYHAYRINKEKKKANGILQRQNAEIEAQADALAMQNNFVEKRNRDMMSSLEYGGRIQRAIVPAIPDLKGLINSFVLHIPKNIVSGDFYWFKRRDNLLFFAVADCTGHGVPGAFMSIVGNFGLNKIVNEELTTKPSEILTSLNSLFIKTLERRDRYDIFDGMDIGLCLLNLNTLEMEYSGANISLQLIRKADLENPLQSQPTIHSDKHNLFMLKPNNQPVGSNMEFKPFINHQMQLLPGDSIYMYSDGYTDQFGGPKRRKYHTQELRRKLLTFQQRTMLNQKEILLKEFYRWKGDNEQIDDITVLGIRIPKNYSL
ncbi:MAG TPA: tetratricopeptide repeat protein [Williamwhitmania sp.]|nr:tetratricopeptide repeat protein [Williamwhitmania sp.]